MALTDGDPRVAASDLYAAVTRLEQRFAEEAFDERLKLAGRNDPQYRDDEPAIHVAAEAIRTSTRRLASRVVLATWSVFLALVLATFLWPGMRGPFMLSIFLSAVTASGIALLWVAWRSNQVRRWLKTRMPLAAIVASSPPSLPMPAVDGRLGPMQLAPVLMERVTRAEAVLAESFFPGEGQVSTGRPSWDGGPRDRVRLRRCFYASAILVLFLGGIIGPLLLDTLGSWAASGFDGDSGPSGIFVLGWFGSIAWFIRRRGQIRSWYKAGVGHEFELARRAVPAPAPEGPVRASRATTRAAIVMSSCVSLFIVGLGVWDLKAELDVRAQTQPFADGMLTTGTVVNVRVNDSDATTFRAVSRFTDQQGQWHTVTGQSGDHEPRVGDKVKVSYRPTDPTGARDLTSNANAWKFPLGTSIFEIAMGLLGVVMVLVLLVKRQLRWNP